MGSETVLTLGMYLCFADLLALVSFWEALWPEGQLEWVDLGTRAVLVGDQRGELRDTGVPQT